MAHELTLARPVSVPWRAYSALGFGILCLTLGAFFVKWAHVPGPVSGFYRLAVASIILTPWWLMRRTAWPAPRVTLTALLAGALFAMDLVLWNTAMLSTSAANAALFGNSAPIWVGLGALLLFRERLGSRFWLGLGVAFPGAMLILGADGLTASGAWHGNLLSLAAGFFYAGYLLVVQQVRTRLDALGVLTLSVLAGVVILFVICLALGMPLLGYSSTVMTYMVGLGLISQVAGALTINYALGHIRATVASVSMLAQPVLTALLAIPLVGEPISMTQIAGGTLVLGGIYLVSTRTR